MWPTGFDAWVIPEPEESRFSRRVEVALGFPYANWQVRPAPQRSKSLLRWTDPSFEFKCDETSPLIVPSAGRLPCDWIVYLPQKTYKQHSKNQPMEWFGECKKIFQQLNVKNPKLWVSTSWKAELSSYCECDDGQA